MRTLADKPIHLIHTCPTLLTRSTSTFIDVSLANRTCKGNRKIKDKVTKKYSAVAEMGDRLATIDMGRKLGAVSLWGREVGPHLTQCGHG